MRNLWILWLLITGCTFNSPMVRETISLSGEWGFRVDSLDAGVNESWFNEDLEQTIQLPGSMAENGYGEEVSLTTEWTGSIVDMSYFTEERYEKYRQPGNLKIPFWLKPVKYYAGPAWYQKNVEIPGNWEDKRVFLHLERCHWESRVFVNGMEAETGNSLSAPHVVDITSLIRKGPNRITIRVDNRMVIPVGVNSHSVSDHTQSNWNGIVGKLYLEARNQLFLKDVQVFPEVQSHRVRTVISLENHLMESFHGSVELETKYVNSEKDQQYPTLLQPVNVSGAQETFEVIYDMGPGVSLWSEFNPELYEMTLTLRNESGDPVDRVAVEFGMRDFSRAGTQFQINGHPLFLRGTLECCIFPLTGYPPTDRASWENLLRQCREHGLNHIRFHSWCPPAAAFEAADRLGFYLQVECGSWANQGSSIGDGNPLDSFIYRESDRILEAYGNHPSFCMLAYGNEPAGKNMNQYLSDLMDYWRGKDQRRVYTAGAGWPLLSSNDYHNGPQPRIQQWGAGLNSIINGEPPRTNYDWREIIAGYNIPFVSHEIGQWCVYPDFREIERYSGVLKPTNLEIFRETLEENHMGEQALDFLMASGKLQALCYKAEIEAALRTPGLAGFQLLQLHDFPGQGTALVGILNPFFQSKGYISPEEFTAFCNQTVPLARLEKRVFLNSEEFKAGIEVAHFGEKPLSGQRIICRLSDGADQEVHRVDFQTEQIPVGRASTIGQVTVGLDKFTGPARYRLTVSLENTPYSNSWDFWVYPDQLEIDPGRVFLTGTLDQSVDQILSEGGSVLLLLHGKVGEKSGAQVAIGFSSIFWNTAWTSGQAPHTLGILCDPEHPVFGRFPTEYHTNWQWWDPITHSQAMILDGFAGELTPLIQPIDTWFENRRLGLAFEAKAGNGKIMVCSIDLQHDLENRPVSRQLLYSVLEYMNSTEFDPGVTVETDQLKELWQ